MAKLTITKLEVNTPNPNSPCSNVFSCAATVEGVVNNDEALREAVEMVYAALRKQLSEEEKAGETVESEGTTPDADNDTDGSADNVKKWMDEAPDGDGSTASGDEDADDRADASEAAARMALLQRQYVHISLPGCAHISVPEDYVFFGPARIFMDNMS